MPHTFLFNLHNNPKRNIITFHVKQKLRLRVQCCAQEHAGSGGGILTNRPAGLQPAARPARPGLRSPGVGMALLGNDSMNQSAWQHTCSRLGCHTCCGPSNARASSSAEHCCSLPPGVTNDVARFLPIQVSGSHSLNDAGAASPGRISPFS